MISFYLLIVNTEEERDKVTFIYEKFYSFMCYTAKQYLDSNYDIEDAVHNSMLKIIENLDLIDISDEKRVKNLCGIISKNKAIDFVRLKKNHSDEFSDEIYANNQNDELDPSDLVLNHETYNLILNKIRSLDSSERIDDRYYMYTNESNDYIIIEIAIIDTYGFVADNEKNKYDEISLHGSKAYFMFDDVNQSGAVIWADGAYTITVEGIFNKEELLKIAENIK